MMERDEFNGVAVARLLGPAALTTTTAGTAVDLQQIKGQALLRLDMENTAGTLPTLDVSIYEAAAGGAYTLNAILAFGQITDAADGGQSVRLDPRATKQYIYGLATIGGTNTPTFVGSLLLVDRPMVI